MTGILQIYVWQRRWQDLALLALSSFHYIIASDVPPSTNLGFEPYIRVSKSAHTR
jgi:hypothetical protein